MLFRKRLETLKSPLSHGPWLTVSLWNWQYENATMTLSTFWLWNLMLRKTQHVSIACVNSPLGIMNSVLRFVSNVNLEQSVRLPLVLCWGDTIDKTSISKIVETCQFIAYIINIYLFIVESMVVLLLIDIYWFPWLIISYTKWFWIFIIYT